MARYPSTVSGFVVPVIVAAVKHQSTWTQANLGKEVLEGPEKK
jgi:hypothetical protein